MPSEVIRTQSPFKDFVANTPQAAFLFLLDI